MGHRNIKNDRIDLNGSEGRAYLNTLIKKHDPNLAEIFRAPDRPKGFLYVTFVAGLNENRSVRTIGKEEYAWVVGKITSWDSSSHCPRLGRRRSRGERVALDGPRGRVFLRALIDKHKPNMRQIFQDEDKPAGCSYSTFMNYLSPKSDVKTMDKADHAWVVGKIRAWEQRKAELAAAKDAARDHVSSSDFINNFPFVYTLAGKGDFKPLDFRSNFGSVLAGYAAPVRRLFDFFNAQAGAKEEVDTCFMTLRSLYEAVSDPAYRPPGKDEKTARIVVIGRGKEEQRLLSIVSPALFKEMQEVARAENNGAEKKVAEDAPIRPIGPLKKLIPSVPSIEAECSSGKAVEVINCGAGIAAVPLATAQALKSKHFPDAPDDFMRPLTATDFCRRSLDNEALAAGRCFYNVTRGSGWQHLEERHELFALVPLYLAAALDRKPSGIIEGVRDEKGLTFSFNAKVRLQVIERRAYISVSTNKQTAVTRGCLDFLVRAVRVSETFGESQKAPKRHRHGFPEASARLSVTFGDHGKACDVKAAFRAGSWQELALAMASEGELCVNSWRRSISLAL